VEEIEEDEILGDGFVARLADQVFENPAMSGGLFVMALTAAAIVSNAMMMQNGRHPDPFFMTRPTPAAQAPVPLPRVRSEEVARAPAPVPLPRVAPQAATPAAPVAEPRLVAEIQRLLAAKKFYAGAADGIAGSRTRAAITAYEKSAGLPVTGVASADLLARLKSPVKLAAAKAPAAKPAPPVAIAAVPPPPARVAIQAAPRAAPSVAAEPVTPLPAPPVAERRAVEPAPALEAPEPAPPVVAVDPAPLAAAPAPPLPARVALAPLADDPVPPPAPAAPVVAETPIPQPGPDPVLVERQHYRSIQNALNQAGYGPLPIDGIASEETASAIRRFELDNGLPLTGKPGDRVAARLVAIGAMAAN
jgi:peptidoglycan hydrolase-like protein with peptidoglycan-binding domain